MSHAKMVEINSERLKQDIKTSGGSVILVTRAIGKSHDYLRKALRKGTISEASLISITKLIGKSPEKYIADKPKKEEPKQITTKEADEEICLQKIHRDNVEICNTLSDIAGMLEEILKEIRK